MKFLTPLLIFGISIAIFFWYVNPAYTNIKTLTAQAAAYNDAIDRTQAAQQEINTLTSKYNSISKEDIARLTMALPDKVDSVRSIIEINSIASKYGASLQSIKAGEDTSSSASQSQLANAPDAKPYISVPLTFTISLTYNNFLSFMADLEQDLHITDITSVNFTPADTSSIYNFTITLNTYKLK